MQRHHSTSAQPAVRPVNKFWLVLAKYRKAALAIILSLMVVAAGTAGYRLGASEPVSAALIDDTASVEAFTNQLAAQNEMCAAVEQVNLQKQLDAAENKNLDLKNSLDTQQDEIDGLEETILNALMANLSDQLMSRSSKSVDAYQQEAKSLISLSTKLNAFEKTSEASKVDLTTYQEAIDNRLLRLPTLKPIPGGLDGYGWRIHPIYGYRHFHPAADMGAAKGTPIKASGAGYVTEAAYNSSAGNYIKISHGNGFATVYMHCSKLYVHAGQTVDKGEVIGAVGSTGTSTTPHLHFEIRLYGNPVNPRQMIME